MSAGMFDIHVDPDGGDAGRRRMASVTLTLTLYVTFLARCLNAIEISGDYCTDKPFSASCNNQEVIVIKTAQYGRMDFSECVSLDFGYLGCYTDVLFNMDKLCSGRQLCEFSITNTLNVPNPCLLDLKRYLHISFTCVKVESLNQDRCQENRDFVLKTGSGYLSSVVSAESGCGTSSRPWVIEALSFQVINFTLWDFSIRNFSSEGIYIASAPCISYATIEEIVSGEVYVICGGNKRITHAYLSHGNRVRIMLNAAPGQAFSPFLLHYEVTGCRAPVYPEYMWARRKGLQLTVGCRAFSHQWRLECRNNTWVGKIGNCTEEEETKLNPIKEVVEQIPHDVVVACIASVAVVISAAIVTVGVIYIKRRAFRSWRERRRTVRTPPSRAPRHRGLILAVAPPTRKPVHIPAGSVRVLPPRPISPFY